MALKLRDLVARIRLIADKGSSKKAESEVSDVMNRIGATAKRVGAMIASAFAVGAIIRFAQVSVQNAIEEERAFNRLSGTLASLNVNYKDQEARIKAAARAMQDSTTVGDGEFADMLARLATLTGDYNLALTQTGLVADVAARYYGGNLTPAIDLVGRALTGQTRALRQVGIMTDDVNEGLRILRERSAGAAANELNSLDGRMKQLGNSMGDVREELGFLIMRIFGGSETTTYMNRFRLGLDGIADALSKIGTFKFKGWRRLGGFIVPDFGFTDRAQPTAAADPTAGTAILDPVIALADSSPTSTTPRARAGGGVREEVRRQLQRAAEDRRRALDQAAATRQRLGDQRDADWDAVDAFEAGLSTNRGITTSGGTEELGERENRAREFFETMEDVGTNAAFGVAHAWQDFFAVLFNDIDNAGEAFEALGRGMLGSLAGAVAEYASLEMKKNLAAGFAILGASLGFPFSGVDPVRGSMSAQNHFAAAGLWGVLAGAAGAAQGAATGGRGMSGGIPSGASDIGGRIADRTGPKAQTIIYVDGFSPRNGEHVRILTEGIKEAGRRDSSVQVLPRNAGRR